MLSNEPNCCGVCCGRKVENNDDVEGVDVIGDVSVDVVGVDVNNRFSTLFDNLLPLQATGWNEWQFCEAKATATRTTANVMKPLLISFIFIVGLAMGTRARHFVRLTYVPPVRIAQPDAKKEMAE